MLKTIVLAFLALVVGFVVFVATRPSTYRVERSQVVHAPADVVFAQIDDFHSWAQWSPWEKLDPNMKKTYEGTPGTVGSWYAWQGNRQVGQGKMTVLEREAPSRLSVRLDFIQPFTSTATTELVLANAAEGTNVTWSMDGQSNFVSKLFGLFVSMDDMIGRDYEKGLTQLAAVSEAEAQRRAKEAADAAEKARAEAAAKEAAAAAAQASAQAPAAPAHAATH